MKNRVALFNSSTSLNDWLEANEKVITVIDIQYKFAPANHNRYMVWYRLNNQLTDKTSIL